MTTTQNQTMRAIQVSRTGGPEVLETVQLPVPTPRRGQVLVKVAAVGLNFADILNVRGEYLTRPKLPMVPGMEFAGTVEALGEGVSGLEPGQLVAALGSGGFAEYALVPAAAVVRVPETFTAREAAAFPVSYFTAYFALSTLGQAREGETVLVQAAGGALGTASVQLAKAMKLRVIATASNEAKLELARSLGAEATFVSDRPDLLEAVREASGGRGVDLLLEVVGGEGFATSVKMLAPRGRLMVIGSASREMATVQPVALMKANASLIGVWLTPLLGDPSAMAGAVAFLEPLLRSGQVKPVVGRAFPLEKAGEAFDFVLSRQSTGKVIIEP